MGWPAVLMYFARRRAGSTPGKAPGHAPPCVGAVSPASSPGKKMLYPDAGHGFMFQEERPSLLV